MKMDDIIASMTPEQKQAVAALIDLHNECNSELSARVVELEAERAELVKDAERYRHIRGMFGFNSFGIFLPCGPTRNKDELAAETDAAIDAQVAQSGVTN